MKRLFLSLSVLMLAVAAMASPVTREKTYRIASAFFRENGGRDSLVEISSEFTNLRIYVGDKGKGFVILPTDDAMSPILGYSVTTPCSSDDMAEATRAWLDMYDRQIAYLQENGIEATEEVEEEWMRLERFAAGRINRLPAKTQTVVNNLLTTTWKQAPYYNAMCPYDSAAGARTITGCGPTAIAQVMKYWNYPPTGIGSHSYYHPVFDTLSVDFTTGNYDWANMPNALGANSTQTEVNAVAKLMYHVGVACEADYSVGGTGIVWYYDLCKKIEDFFGYRNRLQMYFSFNTTVTEWKDILRFELDHSRPVLYCNEVHAFVCSGYDNNDRFWFNWGWGGRSDGYYTLTSSYPFGSIDSIFYSIITGIEPSSQDSLTVITTVQNNLAAGSVSGGGTYVSFRDTVRLKATANPGYRFKNWNVTIKENPLEFVADGVSETFVANFEKIEGDRMGYADMSKSGYPLGIENVEWQLGIRLDPVSLAPDRRLTDVEFFRAHDNYILHLYQGGDTAPVREVYSETIPAVYPEDSILYHMDTFTLTQPYVVDHTQSLWITLEAPGCWYPLFISSVHSGNIDGGWFRCVDSLDWWNIGADFVIYGLFDDAPAVPTSVEEVDGTGSVVAVNGNVVTIEGAEGEMITIYDSLGRMVRRRESRTTTETFTLPSGVYMIRINDRAQKVIVR